MKPKHKIFIFVLIFLLTMSGAKVMMLLESKDILETMLVEQKKTNSLYKKLISDVVRYVEAKGDDKVLLESLVNIQDYMEVYATPKQMGRSSHFHQQIQESLNKEISSRELE